MELYLILSIYAKEESKVINSVLKLFYGVKYC